MHPDTVAFEAAYLRAALLIGLVREHEVPSWAEHVLTRCPTVAGLAADALVCPIELTAMREALAPLANGADDQLAQRALLTTIRLELPQRGVRESVRVLEHMRHELVVVTIADAVKTLHDRLMLVHAEVRGELSPTEQDLLELLADVAPPGFFELHFDDASEAHAFVAALSRVMVRTRAWSGHSSVCWLRHEAPLHVIVLDEVAWRTAVDHFSPLPLRSRIPRLTLASDAQRLLDSETTAALGAGEAARVMMDLPQSSAAF